MAKAFIYGSLKSDQYNASFMARIQATKLGNVTTNDAYPLYVSDRPYPFLQYQPGQGKKIKGELWHVPDAMVPHLDSFEGAPTLYHRVEISVTDGQNEYQAQTYCRTAEIPLDGLTLLESYKGPTK